MGWCAARHTHTHDVRAHIMCVHVFTHARSCLGFACTVWGKREQSARARVCVEQRVCVALNSGTEAAHTENSVKCQRFLD